MSNIAVKRVAKNTIVMFIRMLVLMIISFLSSRWLLEALGVEDYGIYSVVGSVTSAFVALKSLFSESTQRFLSFYKGKADVKTQKDVYTISLLVHFVLAILFVVILEIAGMWLINNKLVFPAEKYSTVVFVFQMTVVASVFSIFSIPFDALIIANERMGYFAFVSILDGLLRLLIVMAIPFLPYNSLKAYSLLLVFIPLLTLLLYYFYCKRFQECSLTKSINKSLFKEIISLSGWNFFGNISFSLLHEGINFILNIFGGLVYNAARAIAYQVRNIAVQFSTNTLIAVRPMVMQSAAIGDNNDSLYKNIIEISRISFMVLLIPIAPLETYCTELLQLWLLNVPENAPLFTRLILISILFRSFHEPLNMLYMSVGRIKRMMIIETIVMIGTLIGIFVALLSGLPLWTSFAILAIMELVIVMSLLVNAKIEINFILLEYMKDVILPMALLFVLNEVVIWFFYKLNPETIIATILLCFGVVVSVCILIFLFLKEKEKSLLMGFVKNRVKMK